MVHPPKLEGMEDDPSHSPPHHFYIFFFNILLFRLRFGLVPNPSLLGILLQY
ncbi:hypothetical protein HanRHA438_Chr08g0339621 [Helianthus annuus]|nr:hypothetical protein HanRHA438_Chr08g0339621 [Helianthus annuus]